MLTNSQAYETLKKNHQSDIEVVIVCCHAVPALNAYMKAVEGGTAKKLPNPDHFQSPESHERLRGIIPRYKKTLGRMLFLASFAYFEAYAKDLIEELVKFHGGKDHWIEVARRRLLSKVRDDGTVNKLRERKKRQLLKKYEKAICELEVDPSFRFPSEKLAIYGLHRLNQDMGDMRSVDIEEMVSLGLGLQLAEARWKRFHELRTKRNNIAHGKVTEVDFSEAINASKHLFQLAKDIDRHTVRNLMIIEDKT